MEDLLNAAYTYLDTPDDMEKISLALEGIDKDAMESDTISEAYKNLYDKLLETAGPGISKAYADSGNKAYKAGEYDAAIKDLEKAFPMMRPTAMLSIFWEMHIRKKATARMQLRYITR